MAEPVTTITASALVTLAFQKFLESGAGELAKKFTGAAISKMDELRQKIWDKLRGTSPRVDEALTQVEQGDCAALTTIARNLHIPPNLVVECVPTHRKPPEVRICRLSIQSGVGTRPPSTSTPHWPAC
jgi:hypothetical protein